MDYLNKHILDYGYDRDAIKIKDKLYRLIEDEIISLGFEHVFDDEDILLTDIFNLKRPGYIYKNDLNSLFFMCEVRSDIKKARERVFEILCRFRKFFISLSRFTIEFSSNNDDVFYLIGYVKRFYKLITIKIEDDFIKICIHKCVFEYVCNYYFNSSLRNYKAGLIIFDENKSTVNKIKKQLLSNANYYISDAIKIEDKKVDFSIEGLPYFIIISNSLSKKEEIKFVSLLDGIEKSISIHDYIRLVPQIESKENDKIYKNNLNDYLKNGKKGMHLCKSCAEIKSKELFIAKSFTQNENNERCDCCNSCDGVMMYAFFD